MLLWVKLIEAICQLRPKALFRLLAHPDGLFRVRNVPDGATVVVTVSKPGMTFTSTEFTVHGGAVSMGAVFGTPPPAITGRVTDGTIVLANVNVFVYDSSNMYVASAYTDPTGNYAVYGLAPGNYYLSFSSMDAAYLPTWYLNAQDFYGATPVPVVPDQTTGDMNVALVRGGTISGQVTDGAFPLSSVSVYITRLDSNGYTINTWGAYTDTNGDSGTHDNAYTRTDDNAYPDTGTNARSLSADKT